MEGIQGLEGQGSTQPRLWEVPNDPFKGGDIYMPRQGHENTSGKRGQNVYLQTQRELGVF